MRLPFEKPKRRRHIPTLRAYHAEHPRCEITDCGAEAMPWPHHIRPVSLGGHDDPDNLLSLCSRHHVGPAGWHLLGKREWCAIFLDRLPRATARRVARIANTEDLLGP